MSYRYKSAGAPQGASTYQAPSQMKRAEAGGVLEKRSNVDLKRLMGEAEEAKSMAEDIDVDSLWADESKDWKPLFTFGTARFGGGTVGVPYKVSNIGSLDNYKELASNLNAQVLWQDDVRFMDNSFGSGYVAFAKNAPSTHWTADKAYALSSAFNTPLGGIKDSFYDVNSGPSAEAIAKINEQYKDVTDIKTARDNAGQGLRGMFG